MLRATLAAFSLLALTALAVPASADPIPDLGVTITDPSVIIAPIVDCDPALGAPDSDGDGYPDPQGACSTPTCGCYCPVVGSFGELQAAGSELDVWAATSGCQTAFAVEGDVNAVDPLGPAGATVDPYVWPAGLGSILDDVEFAVASALPATSFP